MTQHFDEENWEHQVTDSQDVEILMHREAHFGGNFDVMLDYYKKEGKGCSPAITIERIIQLAELERTSGNNLAGMMLSGADAEKIQRVRELYKNLRSLYENPDKNNPIPLLIAELILSEEHSSETIVNAFLPYKISAISPLVEVLRNLDLHDPLFPGYGFAPELAAECLAKIGDRRAIIALFEAIGDGDFFQDEGILCALKAIGVPAKEFLLKILKSKPINEDNEKAAIALEYFKGDQEVGTAALELLKTPEVLKDLAFATYMVFLCEGLSAKEFKEPLERLLSTEKLPKELLRDVKIVIKSLI